MAADSVFAKAFALELLPLSNPAACANSDGSVKGSVIPRRETKTIK